MATRDIYLKIEPIHDYSPVEPDEHVTPPIEYRRDCMRNPGHEDGTIPGDEVNARRLTALIYREYLDPRWLVPKPDKLVIADVNEPSFVHRVPGTVIYASAGQRLRFHVKNADILPHSFHVHGLRYGIDSDGSWPLGTQTTDGRRSDEICPGQSWTYTFDVTDEMIGAWPFHDHHRNIGVSVNSGLFGGIIVLPRREYDQLAEFPLPVRLREILCEIRAEPHPHGSRSAPLLKTPMRYALTARVVMTPLGTTMGSATAVGGMSVGGMSPGDMPVGGMPVGGMPVGGAEGHGLDLEEIPPEIAAQISLLDELSPGAQLHQIPKPPHALHVPIFLHQMGGVRSAPVFESGPLSPPTGGTPGATYTTPAFSFASVYNYYCGIHGPSMSGSITVQLGAPSTVNVTVLDFQFVPASVTVGVGGRVVFTNAGPSLHSVVEAGGDSMISYCMNGRSFVGNTPTILAEAGQKIRWYVFNLDLSMSWHNFHTHAQRWQFARDTIDVRSIGPAESFVVETTAPPVLLLPPHLEAQQHHLPRPPGVRRYDVRGDFLVHCHVEMHMMAGMVGLVRSHQTLWLTPEQAAELQTDTGLPIDSGDNDCSDVDLSRCQNAMGGQWQTLPGTPGVTMMHAVLLANTERVLFWGYGPMADQSRIWDQAARAFTTPANQPQSVTPDENVWSCGHAYLPDATGTILVFGGFFNPPAPPLTLDTELRAFLFDTPTQRWSVARPMTVDRFYPTGVSLADGRVLVLYGQDTGRGTTSNSFEIYDGNNWSAPKALPFNYFYYPWTFVLPSSELFVAGPQKPARRFDPAATTIIDDPARQYPQTAPQRGLNMDGTAVLLPLEPPDFAPRILIAGGASSATEQSAEWIDLSAPTPTWQALPNLNVARDKLNAVLLPDGRVFFAGGVPIGFTDGGPAEIFDPKDPSAGFQIGPSMVTPRRYHSAAILLLDGSVLMGGDSDGGRDGATLPHERYLPSYFFQPRPVITTAPPSLAYGGSFDVATPEPAAIAEIVLMRPGAVTHGFNQAQRRVGCAISATGGGTITFVAPPNGNVAPPGHYLLFLVDRDRIPSTGTWVRLG